MGWRFATAQNLVKNPKEVKKKPCIRIKKKKTVQGGKSAWRKGIYPVKDRNMKRQRQGRNRNCRRGNEERHRSCERQRGWANAGVARQERCRTARAAWQRYRSCWRQ